MREIFLLKCGELVLKGLNRSRFEAKLLKNTRAKMRKYGKFDIYAKQSVIYVEPLECDDTEEAFKACTEIFGINTVQRCAVCEKNIETACKTAAEYLKDMLSEAKTFKVESKRGDKSFDMTSVEISREIGGYLDDAFPDTAPQMDNPDVVVRVELRERGFYISGKNYKGAGGMPIGTNGRGLLMLSGGIDSPVAGHMMAKRGLELAAVHFFSYPYTSEEAKQKVLHLAEIMSVYTGKIPVFIAPFTEIQEAIRDNCFEDLFTVIMRRFMVKVADRIAKKQLCGCVITGESLGQVASQTVEALNVTNSVADLPIFRPLIGMDKDEITVISRKIGTFETSILPYEDCCTVFTPKHPVTKPKMEKVLAEEAKLDVEGLVERAVANTDYIVCGE